MLQLFGGGLLLNRIHAKHGPKERDSGIFKKYPWSNVKLSQVKVGKCDKYPWSKGCVDS